MASAIPRFMPAHRYGLWTDEIGACRPLIGVQSFWQLLRVAPFSDTIPPLYNILGWLGMRFTGTVELGFRLPSVLASALAVYLIALLGRAVGGTACGIVCAVLMALAPTSIRYGYDGRPYALEMMLTVALWLVLRRVSAQRLTAASLSAIGSLALVSLMTHYFLAVPLGVLGSVYLLNREHWRWLRNDCGRNWRLWLAALVWGCALTWGALFLKARLSGIHIDYPNHHADFRPLFFARFLGDLWLSDTGFTDLFGWKRIDATPLVIAVLAVAGLVLAPWGKRDRLAASSLLCAGWVLIPLLVWQQHNILSVRFALFAQPALVLLLGQGFVGLATAASARLRARSVRGAPVAAGVTAVCVLCAAILARGTASLVTQPYYHEWREIASYMVNADKRHADLTVCVSNGVSERNLRFYEPTGRVRIQVSPAPASLDPDGWLLMLQESYRTPEWDTLVRWASRRRGFDVRGTLPAFKAFPPDSVTSTPQTVAALQSTELEEMRQIASGERRGWVLSDLGAARRASGDQRKSKEAFEALLALDLSPVDNAYALLNLNRLDGAVEQYRTALDRTPAWEQKAYIWSAYAQALHGLSVKRGGDSESLEMARSALRRAVELDGSTSGSFFAQQLREFEERYPAPTAAPSR
jgi:hypothetical protein